MRSGENGNVARGRSIDFLGYCITSGHVRLRKSMKIRFAKKMSKIKSGKRRTEIMAAYWGWCKWGDCKHLWQTITGNMGFGKKGIRPSNKTRDGKKFFDVPQVKLIDIMNVPITVVDFEGNVKTKQGDDRYCVLIERNGSREKFITNCYNLKDVLNQARAAEQSGKQIFPVDDVVIRRRPLGDGKSAYYFDE